MTFFTYFAFLGPPVILYALGWAAVLLQERVTRHHDQDAAHRQGVLEFNG